MPSHQGAPYGHILFLSLLPQPFAGSLENATENMYYGTENISSVRIQSDL